MDVERWSRGAVARPKPYPRWDYSLRGRSGRGCLCQGAELRCLTVELGGRCGTGRGRALDAQLATTALPGGCGLRLSVGGLLARLALAATRPPELGLAAAQVEQSLRRPRERG